MKQRKLQIKSERHRTHRLLYNEWDHHLSLVRFNLKKSAFSQVMLVIKHILPLSHTVLNKHRGRKFCSNILRSWFLDLGWIWTYEPSLSTSQVYNVWTTVLWGFCGEETLTEFLSLFIISWSTAKKSLNWLKTELYTICLHIPPPPSQQVNTQVGSFPSPGSRSKAKTPVARC